jgi:group I intron endonuclease
MKKLKNIRDCVYCFTNKINGKLYVGQTSNMYRRYYEHKKMRFNGKSRFYNAIKKYGFESFQLTILEKDIDIGVINERETYYIQILKTSNELYGYNICVEANTTRGRKRPSIELEGVRKYRKSCVGEKNAFFGKKHSEETKKAIGFANSKNKRSEENKKKAREVIKVYNETKKIKVLQIDPITLSVIKEWDSISEASKSLNIGQPAISLVINKYPRIINGKEHYVKTAGGFIWKKNE